MMGWVKLPLPRTRNPKRRTAAEKRTRFLRRAYAAMPAALAPHSFRAFARRGAVASPFTEDPKERQDLIRSAARDWLRRKGLAA